MKKYAAVLCALTAVAVLLVTYQMVGRPRGLPVKIRIATGGESGVYHAYGDALADALERQMNVTVTAIPSGGSVDNIHLLRNGRAELAFVQNDIMTYAYNGTNLFSTEGAFKDFFAVAALYPETCQIVARRGIDGITELKGRRVSVGHEGSGTELNALQILEAYNMSYSDIEVDHLSFAASVAAFKEGRIDAFFCTAGVPTPAIRELSAGGEARILNVGDAHAHSLISVYPYYSRQTIPAGAYPKIGDEAETVAVKATLVASGSLDKEVVAEIVKILFESEEVAKVSPSGKIDRESAVEGVLIPLHPAAEAFFRK
ncbi:MAG: TAXI family TRAP transporter solute-binding subunit [Synergistaceae bacterium]|jgi:TRAP transporter TAXI family solute receptor|nr:TAXI family TRAP transporter solute-binding subunit [Synergistaceae bacterium]